MMCEAKEDSMISIFTSHSAAASARVGTLSGIHLPRMGLSHSSSQAQACTRALHTLWFFTNSRHGSRSSPAGSSSCSVRQPLLLSSLRCIWRHANSCRLHSSAYFTHSQLCMRRRRTEFVSMCKLVICNLHLPVSVCYVLETGGLLAIACSYTAFVGLYAAYYKSIACI
jgi:hypothetical protein